MALTLRGVLMQHPRVEMSLVMRQADPGNTFWASLGIMPIFFIPPNAGPYKVVTARAGNPLVCNPYTGKRKVRIPCRTKEQADKLCRRLNDGENGEVFA
jgi:4-alpha-glucanotransferase